jgi:hypothetical protein
MRNIVDSLTPNGICLIFSNITLLQTEYEANHLDRHRQIY